MFYAPNKKKKKKKWEKKKWEKEKKEKPPAGQVGDSQPSKVPLSDPWGFRQFCIIKALTNLGNGYARVIVLLILLLV